MTTTHSENKLTIASRALITNAKMVKVLYCFGHIISKKAHNDSPCVLVIYSDIEVNLRKKIQGPQHQNNTTLA